ncbi:MAG: dTMP kinase [Candidatus Rifleibacteriota bacterium]
MTKDLNNNSREGLFITFEGPEGSGKTTQIEFLRNFFIERNYQVITTREPGGTIAGDKIRDILLDHSNGSLEAETELFLMLAQRSEHLKKVINPAIISGKIVLCDRYFDSSMAYQGYGRRLATNMIRAAHEQFLPGFLPDLTILLLINPETGLKRALHRGKKSPDRMESQTIEFHKRVYEGYQKLAANEPERFILIENQGDPKQISALIRKELEKKL